MKKWVCKVCGYVHEGDTPPETCPLCGVPASEFVLQEEEEAPAPAAAPSAPAAAKAVVKATYEDEHRVGIAKGVDPRILEGLRQNFAGECSEVGMYLAMSRVAERDGYPEVAEAFKRYAFEEAEHAAKFAELLGEVVTDSTKKNLELRAAAEQGACKGKMDLARLAKQLNLDAIHDTVHEMAKDEARHGCGFNGLLQRLF